MNNINSDSTRYRVDIPCYITVYVNNNLSIVDHEMNIDDAYRYVQEHAPSVVDYWDANTEGGRLITDIREALDVHNNALNYARGLHLLDGKQLSEGKYSVPSEEPF